MGINRLLSTLSCMCSILSFYYISHFLLIQCILVCLCWFKFCVLLMWRTWVWEIILNCLHDCIRHQRAIARGSYVNCHDNSSRLHSKAPAEEMNGSPDDSSLLSSTGFLRGAPVSNTRFGRVQIIHVCCEHGPQDTWNSMHICKPSS